MGPEPRHSPTSLFARRGFMHAMSRTDENTRDKSADTGILVRYKCDYVAWHLTLPHRDLRALDALLDTISTRRFCGSPTPPGLRTSRPFSPVPTPETPLPRTPSTKPTPPAAADIGREGHPSGRPRRRLARSGL